MAKSPYKVRRPGTLKEAVTELIDECGGLPGAAAFARVGRSHLFRYSDDSDENADKNIPVDVALALELRTGRRLVTEWLAAQHGCLLFCPEPAEDTAGIPKGVAEIAEHAAQLFHEFGAGMADAETPAHIDGKEAARMLKAGEAMVRVFMALRPELLARIAGRG